PRRLLSFPTRRSSDLADIVVGQGDGFTENTFSAAVDGVVSNSVVFRAVVDVSVHGATFQWYVRVCCSHRSRLYDNYTTCAVKHAPGKTKHRPPGTNPSGR